MVSDLILAIAAILLMVGGIALVFYLHKHPLLSTIGVVIGLAGPLFLLVLVNSDVVRAYAGTPVYAGMFLLYTLLVFAVEGKFGVFTFFSALFVIGAIFLSLNEAIFGFGKSPLATNFSLSSYFPALLMYGLLLFSLLGLFAPASASSKLFFSFPAIFIVAKFLGEGKEFLKLVFDLRSPPALIALIVALVIAGMAYYVLEVKNVFGGG